MIDFKSLGTRNVSELSETIYEMQKRMKRWKYDRLRVPHELLLQNDTLYQYLAKANSLDMQLYEHVKKKFYQSIEEYKIYDF